MLDDCAAHLDDSVAVAGSKRNAALIELNVGSQAGGKAVVYTDGDEHPLAKVSLWVLFLVSGGSDFWVTSLIHGSFCLGFDLFFF
jgi:hypothetical protein